MHELIPWRTLTGRQQLYQDHLWMRAFGEALCVYRPPIDTEDDQAGDRHASRTANKQIVLNFITPHQKWGIHSTYTDNLLMLTLSRGGPIVWISETDAKKAGIVDNDWIEVFNSNGALVARAVVSQRVKEGMCMMYHAQEKIVNMPGSETTGQRGGIHNSVTRTVLKPTHMIGGYAQLAYGFNYYGTVGSNRDEFVIVRKMAKVDWLDKPTRGSADGRPSPRAGGRRMKIRAQIAMVLNLDKCIGCHTCSVTCKNVWTSREGMEYAWFNNVETKPGIGYPEGLGEPEALERRLAAQGERQDRAADRRQMARAGEDLRQSRPAGDRRLLRALHLRLRAPAEGAGDAGLPDRAAALARSPASAWRRSSGGRTGRRSSAASSPSARPTTISRACRRRSTASSKTPS